MVTKKDISQNRKECKIQKKTANLRDNLNNEKEDNATKHDTVT